MKKYGRPRNFSCIANMILRCFIAVPGSASRTNCTGDLRKPGNFYVAVAIVDCHQRGHPDWRAAGTAGTIGNGGGLLGSGGAFKSGRLKKKAIRAPADVYTRMRSRDTRPLYEQYLMDCIGRAQTLNLTFTIIAALRGGLRGAPRGTRGWRDRTMFDVNFIILAKKLRPGSSPSDPFSLSRFAMDATTVFVVLLFFISNFSLP